LVSERWILTLAYCVADKKWVYPFLY
jgi:hypothetical protein